MTKDHVNRPRIVVTRRLPAPAMALLREVADVWVSSHDRPLTVAELREAVSGADAVVSMLHDRVDAALLDAAGSRLRCVANVAVGYDNVDVAAASRRGVVVTNTPGVLTEATADLAMALILTTTRRLGEGERLLRSRAPWSWSLDFHLGVGLQDKTLGIVGLGAIGTATARRARAFGMCIAYAARGPLAAAAAELGAVRRSLDELFATALRRGIIAGAALDVFEREPEVHPDLLDLDNVVIVPHLGSATVETRRAMAALAARNAAAVVAGGEPLTAVRA